MSDPICRWRNSSVKQLLEFNSLFPFQDQPSLQARNIIESRWSILGGKDFFTTPYQLAVQMALYYEDGSFFYPRFNRQLSIEEARQYLLSWAKLYYAPNPYSPSMDKTVKPVIINNFLVNWCIDHDNASFKEALNSMFQENIGNFDILVNMLNNFSEVSIEGDKLTLKDSVPRQKYETVELDIDKTDRKRFFEQFNSCYSSILTVDNSFRNRKLLVESTVVVDFMGKALQEFLKADLLKSAFPQTTTNDLTLGFTGCRFAKLKAWFDTQTDSRRSGDCDTNIIIDYDEKTYYFYKEQNIESLITFAVNMNSLYAGKFLIEIDKTSNVYRLFHLQKENNIPLQRILYGAPGTGKSYSVFSAIAIHSGIIKEKEKLSYTQRKELEDSESVFRTTFHPDYDYAQFVGCYKPKKHPNSSLITYEFTPQVFTNALVKAYQKPEESVYLVIEEINRGNCAQIFGDIFQLLDRKSEDDFKGESEYAINVDEDLKKYLEEKCPNAINNGKIKLPSNFNIIATMNTSDQSLFPMDSAFKRRWEWEYVPIKNDTKFTIKVDNDHIYQWCDFQKAVNQKILDKTFSEDKQMGDYFIKKDVTLDEFISKVMFYLWNDVCKENYHTDDNFFRTKDEKSEDTPEFSFGELMKDKAKNVIGFMNYLEVKIMKPSNPNENDLVGNDASIGGVESKI